MSNGQYAEQQPRYGSRFAQMFGYVTPEDRGRWEQQRAQNSKRVSALKQGAKSTGGAMMEFGQRNMDSKLAAAHRVAQQQQFDESHDKIVTKRRDPKTRSIIETVDYEHKDGRQEIEPDFEL
ncbi:hypothetical protein [Streptomyces sp. NPDC052042]|uniref:hypothetical protein n=1 Tax=Streptomyces sp. NPDC052042 TaxID=3365683 RepID=UPI0037CE9ED4